MTHLGLLLPLLVYGLVFALHLALPARVVEGYVKDERGVTLRYRLNGLVVFVVVLAAFAGGAAGGLWPWGVFYEARWASLASAFVLGLAFTLWVVLTAPPVGSLARDLYLGRHENPQWLRGRVDAKMYLYLVGAVLLALNVVSFAGAHVSRQLEASPGVILYAGLFLFFLAEYLFFERVHLYTYDFVAERVGFKLGWGCLVFYPYFYCVGLWAVAEAPDPRRGGLWLAVSALVFFAGWVLSRGANLQKYWFKRDPQHIAFGFLRPEFLEGGGRRVLVSGFWGLSRHVNYLGEFLMALGLTLSLGHPESPWPWLYPLYYVALLVPRQLDDDRRCAEKYGALWENYRRRVRFRIIPGLY